MLNIEECRKVLGDTANNMTDEEIKEVRDSLYVMAELALDTYIEKCNTGANMKSLKFRPDLVSKVMSGEKTSTWRLFDDKNLSTDDEFLLINKETGEEFAKGKITDVREKKLGELEDADFVGHEGYKDQEDMLNHYKGYYGDTVSLDTPIKMIDFKLI